MNYNDISTTGDIPAALAEYVIAVYGVDVLNSFPPITSIIWEGIMAGLTEESCALDVFIFYKLIPIKGLLP